MIRTFLSTITFHQSHKNTEQSLLVGILSLLTIFFINLTKVGSSTTLARWGRRRRLSTSESWFESRRRWARSSTGRSVALFPFLSISRLMSEVSTEGLVHIFHFWSILQLMSKVIFRYKYHSMLFRWSRKLRDWDRLKHPWRKESGGSRQRWMKLFSICYLIFITEHDLHFQIVSFPFWNPDSGGGSMGRAGE